LGIVCVIGQRTFYATLVALAMVFAVAMPASAAELKISLSELARILTATLGEPKLRLHNVPGGTFSMTAASSLTLGATTVALPIPARTFVVGGTTYAYYVNEVNSSKITVSAVPTALRFTVVFTTAGPALVGKCVSGFCLSDGILPEIQWTKPSVSFDLTPVWINGNLSLDLKRVDIGGTFTPDCDAAKSIFSGGICELVLPKARAATRTLKTDLDKTLKDQVNAPEIQAKLAAGLRSYLKFGPVGEVRFSKVAVDADNVTLTFCLACQTQ
jgi:hypothetical protein